MRPPPSGTHALAHGRSHCLARTGLTDPIGGTKVASSYLGMKETTQERPQCHTARGAVPEYAGSEKYSASSQVYAAELVGHATRGSRAGTSANAIEREHEGYATYHPPEQRSNPQAGQQRTQWRECLARFPIVQARFDLPRHSVHSAIT